MRLRLDDQFPASGIDPNRNLGRVPTVFIVLGELEIPIELAGIGIERDGELLYRLSPARPSPRFDGDGFPVGQKI